MAKTGMKKYVTTHKDPTYNQAWRNIRREEKAAAEAVMLRVRKELKDAGYILWCDLKIKHRKSGAVYVSKSEYVEG